MIGSGQVINMIGDILCENVSLCSMDKKLIIGQSFSRNKNFKETSIIAETVHRIYIENQQNCNN